MSPRKKVEEKTEDSVVIKDINTVNEDEGSAVKGKSNTSEKIYYTYTESLADKAARLDANAAELEAARTAQRNETFPLGMVAGVENLSTNRNGVMQTKIMFSVLLSASIKVLIPFEDFFYKSPVKEEDYDLKTVEGRKRYCDHQTRIAENVIGYNCRFKIEQELPEDENGVVVLIGNRRAVLENERSRYWLGDNPIIKEGNTYTAHVVAVMYHGVLVHLGGYERYIPDEVLTNRYVTDCHNLYQPGDSIKVLVTRKIVNSDMNTVRAMLNAIIPELEACRPNLDKIQVPSRRFEDAKKDNINTKGIAAVATISKIVRREDREDNRAIFYAWIQGYDVPGLVTSMPINRKGSPLRIGDQVAVTITGKTKLGYATIFIRKTINSVLGRGF